jgi:hypothetical protein
MNTPSNEPNNDQSIDSPNPKTSSADDSLTLSDTALAAQQEQYRKAYIEQLRRMSCPGCGDDGVLPM